METGFRRRVYIAIMYCRVGGGVNNYLMILNFVWGTRYFMYVIQGTILACSKAVGLWHWVKDPGLKIQGWWLGLKEQARMVGRITHS